NVLIERTKPERSQAVAIGIEEAHIHDLLHRSDVERKRHRFAARLRAIEADQWGNCTFEPITAQPNVDRLAERIVLADDVANAPSGRDFGDERGAERSDVIVTLADAALEQQDGARAVASEEATARNVHPLAEARRGGLHRKHGRR